MTETVSRPPIAIVGLGCVLPDAPDIDTFWDNLLAGKSSIREVSHDRWDPALYYHADKGPDKTYTKIGAFVDDDSFNGLDYRMPPKAVEQIDPCQRWALSAARQALQDAGYTTGLKGDEGRDFDRDRCAVIIGNAMGGESNKTASKRLFWPEARKAIQDDDDFQALPQEQQNAILERAEERYKSTTLPVTEDTMPGHLSNVVAGRIANVFDLGGKNFTTDAACASSLAALDAACSTLQEGESDMVLWGGTDRSMDITPYIEFSAIGALSPDGSRPFDKDANGFVMGEGCAMFVLKRLEDAERDGDPIVAVVRGIGSSSDGKGKGITAPNPAGQVKAVRRAYEDASVGPETIGYLEAHGTSTPVGDPVELESVEAAFGDGARPEQKIKVGSVKSNIGHLKAAAGAAGVLKAALSIKHGVIPPSINVRELNPRIDWDRSPFRVATERTDWPEPADVPRRAAVSSFGFGGTNFHVILEQHVPGRLRLAEPVARAVAPAGQTTTTFDQAGFQQHMQDAAVLEAEPVVLSPLNAQEATGITAPTFHDDGEGPRLRDLVHPLTKDGLAAPQRVGFSMADPAEAKKKLALAQKAMNDPAAARLAFNQGIYLGEGKPAGKVAFLFPGQGTQYVNMGRDLATKYQVVADTFAEADEILFDELGGVNLTDILWPSPDTEENRKASEEKLKLTEFTQPAVLTMDAAILRLLKQWGIEPDVVAGHSLGEYGALVAADTLSLADALHAVAARGREMANVDLPDLGKMASISADWHVVDEAIQDVDDYVICANKNCPSQTVIAGSSAGVDAAVDKLKGMGLQAVYLPVSAAFHSKIVAPASEPLRRVLGRLDVQSPKVDVITNVGAQAYPTDPEAIRDNLAVQVASPVDWVGTIQKMYEQGVRTFIEVGPKRALTGFVADILKDKHDIRPVFANHPKKGGVTSINELFAFLGAGGFAPTLPALDDAAVYAASFRDPKAAFTHAAPVASEASATAPAAPSAGETHADPRIDLIADALAALSKELDAIRGGSASTPSTDAPAAPSEAAAAMDAKAKALGICLDDIGISGASVGLPGTNKPLFDDKDWDRILAGENLITPLGDKDRQRMVDKNIVRLVKGKDGQASFQTIQDMAQVIHLAARRGDFDLTDWGVDGDFTSVLDKTSQYALAAGLEALKDAGIPLQRTYIETSTGGHLPKAWKLPEPLRDGTGIIFASAFPGYDNLIGELSRALADRYAGKSLDDLQVLYNDLVAAVDDAELRARIQDAFDAEFARYQDRLPDHGAARYEFNRKFLFNVLSMGHSQLAQFLGARGPNTQVNAACASTTQAIAIAEDWIRTGRARRVLVVGADDATSDNMMEWIGSGFLASGAATTKKDVAQAALPFDARRHGMIIGMGAVGLLVEATPETEARGMRPIARLLATQVSNSAFHGSRLDIEHIAQEMRRLVARAAMAKDLASGQALGRTAPADLAAETVFMSHETYTPARGGSAAAEIHALRATFGAAADKVVIANTKGFTGHPQGAGIEDAVVLKCLQRGQVPPIPNLKERDPELGNLNLSKGGAYDVRYGLRLAAGFGSQVAMTFTELVAREDERIADAATYAGWLAQISGLPDAKTEVVDRTLRIVDQGAPERRVKEEPAVVAPAAPAAPAPVDVAPDAVLDKVTGIVAEKTGYPLELLEADLDLEADLGIDTVKQAELFGELREMYGLPLDESLKLSDYNTLRKVAGYMSAGSGDSPEASADTAPAAPDQPAGEDTLKQVTEVVAEKTGYPIELLEPDLDLEADLGIDTVKQAELFGELRGMFGVELDEELKLSDYNTLRKVADYMGGSGAAPATPAPAAPDSPAATPEPEQATETTSTPSGGTDDAALQQVTEVVAEKTGYPIELLEPDLDLEADLGIDTVKQAELFGELRGMFGVELDEDLKLSDYNTLRKVADYMGQGDARSPDAGRTEAADEPSVEHAIRRFVPTLRPEAAGQENRLTGSSAVILGDAPEDLLSELGWTASDAADALVCWATEPDGPRPIDLFEAAKAHAGRLRTVVVVTAQDGAQGLRSPRDPEMAGIAGIGKALRKELPDALVKVIDLHPDRIEADLVIDELRRGGPRTEVCYDADGTRHVVDVVAHPLDDVEPDLAGKTLVVSGGGQGITATLLQSVIGQDTRLLLLGRTPVPAEAAEWATWDDAAWKEEEARTIEAIKAEGEKPTPVNVRKRVDKKRKAAEVRANIDAMKAAGAQVLYAAVDVTDGEAVEDAVARARQRLGPIHGVVHAAGVEISKMLADKPSEQFDLVYSIKDQGIRNLLDATRDDPLELIAGFGSVAGRFGNIGQTDYSAANEAMAKAITQAANQRGIQTAFTIAWGPWGEIGMATRGGIMTVLEQSGVSPIPTAEGIAAWKRELATPGIREAVVCGELGALDADGQIVHAGTAPEADMEDDRADAPETVEDVPAVDVPRSYRFIDAIEDFQEGQHIRTRLSLDKANDPYLDDHAIDGVPLLPGVFGMEAFAQAASLIVPADLALAGARDVNFAAPLKQHKQTPVSAWVDAEVAGNGDGIRVACRLTSRFIGPDGKAHGEPRIHFTATLLFAPPADLRTQEVPHCDGSIGPDRIYPPFFHGPSFQVLAEAGPVGEESHGTAQGPQGPLFAKDHEFLSHPLTSEALFQLCGLRTLEAESIMSLPAGIQRLDVYEVDGLPTQLWCRDLGKDDDGLRRFDAAACTDDGKVAIRMLGYRMVDLGPIEQVAATPGPVREPQAEAPEPDAPTPEPDATAPEPAQTPAARGPLALPEVDGLVFAAVPVPGAPPLDDQRLTEKERDQVAGFAAPKRACEWAAGRLAAKEAARQAAPELGHDEVTVDQDGSGAPILMVRGQRSPATVSITHRDGHAIAAIGDQALGIDLEPVEERGGAWWSQSFSSDEIDHIRSQGDDDLASTCAWAAKEACLKRAGTGLQTSLHDVRVFFVDDGATVRGPWGDWTVRFYETNAGVLAVTTPSMDVETPTAR